MSIIHFKTDSRKKNSFKTKNFFSLPKCRIPVSDPLGLTSSGGLSNLAKNLHQHSSAFHISDFVSKGKYRFHSLFAGVTFLTKSQTSNTKAGILGLNQVNLGSKQQFPLLFAVFEPPNSQNCEYQNLEQRGPSVHFVVFGIYRVYQRFRPNLSKSSRMILFCGHA